VEELSSSRKQLRLPPGFKPIFMLPVTGAALATAAFPAAASADFKTPVCQGSQAAGVGASLQKISQNGLDNAGDSTGWAFTFSHNNNTICPQGGHFNAENALYQALGSGAGLAAVCVNGTSFSTNANTGRNFDFAASDDPPTSTQVSNANGCAAASSGPLALHTIPVAQAAIAIVVHLPSGCTINSNDNASTKDRFNMGNANLESAYFNGGGAPTWGTLLPNSSSCSGPIIRGARYDQSGTTFQTMQYLAQLNSSDRTTWVNASNAFQPQNWPNPSSNIVYGGTTQGTSGTCPLSGPGATPPQPGTTQTQPANPSLCNGAGNLAQAVLDTPGSIAYVDMATAISKGFQYPTKGTSSTFWVPVQNNGTGTKGATFADPNVSSNGYISGNTTGGANCASSAYTPPSGADPTLSSWASVIGSNPNVANYPLCTLTYELLFNDNSKAFGDNAGNDARSRSVKDYAQYLVSNSVANDGQSILRSLNYDTLPSNVLSAAQTGANAITWSGTT
jgi:ABC-type phosphate transport system substrate-binding protein